MRSLLSSVLLLVPFACVIDSNVVTEAAVMTPVSAYPAPTVVPADEEMISAA